MNRTKIFYALLMPILLCANTAMTDVIGGYVNTHTNEFIVVFDAINSQRIMLGASLDTLTINDGRALNRAGQLFIVSPNGRWQLATRSYRDTNGVGVGLPSNGLDKVVYVNNSGRVVGGMGLLQQEITSVARSYRHAELADSAKLVDRQNLITFMKSVDMAAEDTRQAYRMTDDERRDVFVGTVGVAGGLDAKRVADGILTAADRDESFPISGFVSLLNNQTEEYMINPLIRGVGLISEGDNGGPGNGYVAEGDNGGPGNGYVAEGDNGGPGNGVIMQGTKGFIHIPPVPNTTLHASCGGTFVYVF